MDYEMVSVRDFDKVVFGNGATAGSTSKYPWASLVPNGPGFFVARPKAPAVPPSLHRAGRRFSVRKCTFKGRTGYFVKRKGD